MHPVTVSLTKWLLFRLNWNCKQSVHTHDEPSIYEGKVQVTAQCEWKYILVQSSAELPKMFVLHLAKILRSMNNPICRLWIIRLFWLKFGESFVFKIIFFKFFCKKYTLFLFFHQKCLKVYKCSNKTINDLVEMSGLDVSKAININNNQRFYFLAWILNRCSE